MRKIKIIALFLIALYVFPSNAWGVTNTNNNSKEIKQDVVSMAPGSPDIKAKGAILMDASSGQVLYGLNQDAPWYPASTTKILTGIIAIEKSDLNDIVTISDNAVRVDGTHIGLEAGEKMKMKDLLYALLLNSSNDSAVAIAEHISGSTDKFAKLMNDKAKEIGAKNSNFVNPNGLPNLKHFTTAYDLALITRYAMTNPTFRQIVSTATYEIHREKPNAQKYLSNHNKMIQPFSFYRYPGATGVKTGYTIQARQCIVASAKRDNREYIVVVLGSEILFEQPRALLDYAFKNFHSVDVVQAGEFVKSVAVKNSKEQVNLITNKGFTFSLPINENKVPDKKIIINSGIKAPIKAKQKLGRIDYYYKGLKVGSVDLLAQNNIKLKQIKRKISWGIILVIIGGGFLFLIFLRIRYKYRKMRQYRLKKLNYFK